MPPAYRSAGIVSVMQQRPLKVQQYTLAQRLALAMKTRGIKAPTLAARSDVTRQALYKVLKGKSDTMDGKTLLAICAEVSVRPEWLLLEEGPMMPSPALTDDESQLVYAYRDMGEADRRRLMKIAASLAVDSGGPPNPANPFRN